MPLRLELMNEAIGGHVLQTHTMPRCQSANSYQAATSLPSCPWPQGAPFFYTFSLFTSVAGCELVSQMGSQPIARYSREGRVFFDGQADVQEPP